MFVLTLRYVGDVNAMQEADRFSKLSIPLVYTFHYNFRKRLFYLGKCVCNQFYCMLSYNIPYL